MCYFIGPPDISESDISDFFHNLEIEDISDESLEADEEMWESDQEGSDDDDSILEMYNFFRPGMLRMNISYNLNLHSDLIVADLHLTGSLYRFDNNTSQDRFICAICFVAQLPQIHYSNVKQCHILCTPDQFENNVSMDLNYGTNEYFCYYCERFLWNVSTTIPSCCEQIYDEYFKTESSNFYFTDL